MRIPFPHSNIFLQIKMTEEVLKEIFNGTITLSFVYQSSVHLKKDQVWSNKKINRRLLSRSEILQLQKSLVGSKLKLPAKCYIR